MTIEKIKFLGRLNNVLSQATMLMYKSLILLIIDYADVIYDCMGKKDEMSLQRLQNMAFKNILKKPKLTPTAEIHEELDMPTLKSRRILHTSVQMYKVDRGTCPKPVTNRFTKRSHVTKCHTRSVTTGNYNIPRY